MLWKPRGSACWKHGGCRHEARTFPAASSTVLQRESVASVLKLCSLQRQATGSAVTHSRPTFASLAAAAWPTAAGGATDARPAAQAAAGAAEPAGPAPAAIRSQQPPVRASDTRQASAMPSGDHSTRNPPPAGANQGQPRRPSRTAAVSQPLVGDGPAVLSPDVIQISSGSSEGDTEAPAAARSPTSDPSPLGGRLDVRQEQPSQAVPARAGSRRRGRTLPRAAAGGARIRH